MPKLSYEVHYYDYRQEPSLVNEDNREEYRDFEEVENLAELLFCLRSYVLYRDEADGCDRYVVCEPRRVEPINENGVQEDESLPIRRELIGIKIKDSLFGKPTGVEHLIDSEEVVKIPAYYDEMGWENLSTLLDGQNVRSLFTRGVFDLINES